MREAVNDRMGGGEVGDTPLGLGEGGTPRGEGAPLMGTGGGDTPRREESDTIRGEWGVAPLAGRWVTPFVGRR